MANVTAKLVAARRVGDCIVGTIINDTLGRFESGQVIRTSAIIHEDGDFVSTLNSIYEVTWSPRMGDK